MTENNHCSVQNHTKLAAEIVAAYVLKNSLPAAELPGLIAAVHEAVSELSIGTTGVAANTVAFEKPNAVQIRQSIQPDSIVSFIDGQSYKTLKRHLTGHGLDPHSYRERYGLPADYPLVAPSYAERRSAIAREIGLGKLEMRAAMSSEPSA